MVSTSSARNVLAETFGSAKKPNNQESQPTQKVTVTPIKLQFHKPSENLQHISHQISGKNVQRNTANNPMTNQSFNAANARENSVPKYQAQQIPAKNFFENPLKADFENLKMDSAPIQSLNYPRSNIFFHNHPNRQTTFPINLKELNNPQQISQDHTQQQSSNPTQLKGFSSRRLIMTERTPNIQKFSLALERDISLNHGPSELESHGFLNESKNVTNSTTRESLQSIKLLNNRSDRRIDSANTPYKSKTIQIRADSQQKTDSGYKDDQGTITFNNRREGIQKMRDTYQKQETEDLMKNTQKMPYAAPNRSSSQNRPPISRPVVIDSFDQKLMQDENQHNQDDENVEKYHHHSPLTDDGGPVTQSNGLPKFIKNLSHIPGNESSEKNLNTRSASQSRAIQIGPEKIPENRRAGEPVNFLDDFTSKIPAKPVNSYNYYMPDIRKAIKSDCAEEYFYKLASEHFKQVHQTFAAFNGDQLLPDHEIQSRNVELLPSKPKTLIFDLDETLVHCTDAAGLVGEIQIPFTMPSGAEMTANVNLRPHCKEILEELSSIYQIVVFTASHQAYADAVLDKLDPQRNLISLRLFRDHCIMTDKGVYVKDLRIFSKIDQKDLILVDNSPHCYIFNQSNGIPIIPFYDNYEDQELTKLSSFLQALSNLDDVRPEIESFFELKAIRDYPDDIEELKKLILQKESL